jgi:hypothetical protein
MAATIARFTTFVPATPILSGDMNSELNALVNLLAGNSSGLKAVFKVSDAGDPPLEVNQLGVGPIQKWFQAGVEKARIRNDGSIRTPGVYDSNDNEELLFVATASAVNELTLTNAATTGRPKLSATGGDANIGIDLIPKGTGVVKIQAGAPVAGADAANKDYVDGKRTLWTASFNIADVAARGTDADFSNIQGAWIPSAGFTCTHIAAKFGAGSASGSFTLEFRKQPQGSQAQTTLGSITFNSGTLGVGVEVDIADHTFTALDWVYVVVSAVSSPLQKSVWCSFRGFQTVS